MSLVGKPGFSKKKKVERKAFLVKQSINIMYTNKENVFAITKIHVNFFWQTNFDSIKNSRRIAFLVKSKHQCNVFESRNCFMMSNHEKNRYNYKKPYLSLLADKL